MVSAGGGVRPEAPAEEFPRGNEASLAEERYRALVQNFPNSAIILCDQELRLVLVDGPEIAATGFSKERMEGKTIYESLPVEFVSLVEGNMRRVLRGEEFSAEIPFGDLLYLYNYVPIRDREGRIVYGLILATNVTERRRAEEALRRSEERFAKMFHSLPDAIGVTRASDGVVLEVNPAFETMLGFPRSEAIGKTTLELGLWFEPETRESIVEALREEGKADELEMPVHRKDGTTIDTVISLRKLELDGEVCVFFVLRDVSEKVRTRRALEMSEARFRSLSNATFEGIGVTDKGVILDVNDQLASMYGQDREELIGKPVTTLVAPRSVDLVRSKIEAGIDQPYEHFGVRADGSEFPVEVRGRRAVVLGSTVRLTAIRDITQRKQAEAERERLIAELRARNAEMEQFAYTVSHDLKSPLVTINGFLGILEQDCAAGDTERVGEHVLRIRSAASKMMRLLNDLLELSRIGRVTRSKERLPLREIVNEALELVSGALAAGKVKVVVEDDLPGVFGDRVRLVQVLQNLVENAAKYMGTQPAPLIVIGALPDPERAIVFVRDNGIGILPKHAERVFGLFEKLDPKSEGTGVGLALVRRIVEYHGGGVSVESDGASGSTFVFHLPNDGARGRESEAK